MMGPEVSKALVSASFRCSQSGWEGDSPAQTLCSVPKVGELGEEEGQGLTSLGKRET